MGVDLMNLKTQFNDMTLYLEATDIIDFKQSLDVADLSRNIATLSTDEIDFIKNSFEYVRDKISHSADIGGNDSKRLKAQFSLEQEKLAFPIRVEKGEEDIPLIFAHPDENVIKALTTHKTTEQLWDGNLPTELKYAL